MLQSSPSTFTRPPGHGKHSLAWTAVPTESSSQSRARPSHLSRVVTDPESEPHASAAQEAEGGIFRQQLIWQDVSTARHDVAQPWRTQTPPHTWSRAPPKPAAWFLRLHQSTSQHSGSGPPTPGEIETHVVREVGWASTRSVEDGLSRQHNSTNVEPNRRFFVAPQASSHTQAVQPPDSGRGLVASGASPSVQGGGSRPRDARNAWSVPTAPSWAMGPTVVTSGKVSPQMPFGASTAPGARAPALDYCEALALGALRMIEQEPLLPQGTTADKALRGVSSASRGRRQLAEQSRLSMVFKSELLLAVYVAIYAEPPIATSNSSAGEARRAGLSHSIECKVTEAPTPTQSTTIGSAVPVSKTHEVIPSDGSSTARLPVQEAESISKSSGLTPDQARSRGTEVHETRETTERVHPGATRSSSGYERQERGRDGEGVETSTEAATSATSTESAARSAEPPPLSRIHRVSLSSLGFLELPHHPLTWTPGTPMTAAEVNRALPWVRRCTQRLGHAVEFGRLILPSGVGDLEGGTSRTPRVGVNLSPTVWWAFFSSLQRLVSFCKVARRN